MPRMNGSDVIREIKKIKRLENIPTILYSTSDGEIGNEEAKKAGASFFLQNRPAFPTSLRYCR